MAEFNYTDIDSKIMNYISGKSFQPNPYITMEDLAYLTISHYDFNDCETIGHLIANKRIAQDLCDIFCRLYNEHYQIEKMKLIDEYNADDELSMADNNSSAFNYRFIADSRQLSNHSLGVAIDINPRYNPYINPDATNPVTPLNSFEYVDRTKAFAHKISHTDAAFRIFCEYGFIWGGDWTNKKDYQHFEKLTVL